MEFKLPDIPGTCHWLNEPLRWQLQADHSLANWLAITAGPRTDWFVDPAGGAPKSDAPVALFTPPDEAFMLQAKVSVDFGATFDAGVLLVWASESHWAKLCFEYSPQQQPMIVSVVTRGVSDDCNSQPLERSEVYLRILRQAGTFAFHYSLDGRYWHLVRYFSLGQAPELQVGFSAQSPTGQCCQAIFSEMAYQPGALADLRSGA